MKKNIVIFVSAAVMLATGLFYVMWFVSIFELGIQVTLIDLIPFWVIVLDVLVMLYAGFLIEANKTKDHFYGGKSVLPGTPIVWL